MSFFQAQICPFCISPAPEQVVFCPPHIQYSSTEEMCARLLSGSGSRFPLFRSLQASRSLCTGAREMTSPVRMFVAQDQQRKCSELNLSPKHFRIEMEAEAGTAVAGALHSSKKQQRPSLGEGGDRGRGLTYKCCPLTSMFAMHGMHEHIIIHTHTHTTFF